MAIVDSVVQGEVRSIACHPLRMWLGMYTALDRPLVASYVGSDGCTEKAVCRRSASAQLVALVRCKAVFAALCSDPATWLT